MAIIKTALTRPLRIGISSCFFHADPKRPIFKGKTLLYMEQSLVNWVASKKDRVYLIPTLGPDAISLREQVEDLDGLVLAGGSDVSPKSYGEEPIKPEWAGDYVRDQYEIALVKEFQQQEKPILGVCRGLQLLNVAFGGTLIQDIPSQVDGALDHRNWDIYDQNFHEIHFLPGSTLERLYGGTGPFKINSIHHQGVKKVGQGLVTEALTKQDGIVEAFRLAGDLFIFGVQWHPEFHDAGDQSLLSSTPILDEFLREVRKP